MQSSPNVSKGKKKAILSNPALLLVKSIAMRTGKPVFEIMEWPSTELEYWAAFFSIDENNDKPIIQKRINHATVEESDEHLQRVLGI